MYSKKLRQAKAQLSGAHRADRLTSVERLAELRRNFVAAKIAWFIERELKTCGPLTATQNDEILSALGLGSK